ncbi:MAG: hypothetical protein IJN49_08960 [Clostridia bacterium]|nr:hypothetical protein [Clostridia bacterium]
MSNKKKVFIIISVLFIAILCILGVLHTKNNYNDYITGVNSCINQKSYSNYKPTCIFEGENNNIVKITVEPLFNNCDYVTQKEIICDLTKEINKLYTEYNSSPLLKKSIDSTVYILADTDIYYCELSNEGDCGILKNEKPYNELDYLHERLTLKVSADENLTKYIYGISDIEILEKLIDIKDVEECKKEILYTIAKIFIEDNDSSAKNILISLKNYKDSEILLNEWNYNHEFDGTWYGSNGLLGEYRISHEWIINGSSCYNIYTEDNTKNGINERYCLRKNDALYVFESKEYSSELSNALYVFEYSNGEITYKYYYDIYTICLEKISGDVKLPETSYIPDPSIGMTASEVKNSTWGSPKKINKNTYSWGVREQWVYGDGRYIYLEDGVVTSISTSE